MELLTFRSSAGDARIGVHTDGFVLDLAVSANGSHAPLPSDMLGLLAAGEPALATIAALLEDPPKAALLPLDEVTLLAPIPRPGKIFALAANYVPDVSQSPDGTTDPAAKRLPLVFCKLPNSVVGPGESIVLPTCSDTVDWEIELAVVIGKTVKHATEENALDAVAGYSVFNDVSAREMIYPDRTKLFGKWENFDFINGKWCDTSAPFGPWIVTADAVPNPDNLHMQLSLNGEVRQHGNSSQMIVKVPQIIEFVTRWATLEPGDVIVTGTLPGCGEETGTYLKDGDLVEATIESLGTLKNPVATET